MKAANRYNALLGTPMVYNDERCTNYKIVFFEAGYWDKAEQLEVPVMETKKKVLGEEHPSTLTSLKNLTSTYGNQGRWKEAEQLQIQISETRKRVLRDEHPDTPTSMIAHTL